MNCRFFKFPVLLLVLALSQNARAQVTYCLIHKGDTLYKVKASIEEKDSLLQKWVQKFQAEGYFEAQLLPSEETPSTLIATVNKGPRYRWGTIQYSGDLPLALQRQIKSLDGNYYQQRKGTKVLRAVVEAYAENGFPFAQAQWRAWKIHQGKVNATLWLDPGVAIKMDTLEMVPNGIVKPLFLSGYLGVFPGTAYDEKAILAIGDRLSNLPFLQLVDSPRVSFQNQQATPYLQVKPVPANSLDAFIGVFPKGNSGGAQIAGHVAVEFPNLFKSGKSFTLQWEQFQKGAQQLHAKYLHRGFLHSPWGLWGSVDLWNQDSTFQKNTLQLGVEWNSEGKWQFSGAINRIKSSGREIFTPQDVGAVPIPSFQQSGLWLQGQWRNVKDLRAPRKGWITQLELSGGNRSYPDSASLGKTFAGAYNASAQYYWPVGESNIWYNQLRAVGIWGTQNAANELLRLGGLATLRGFNEQQFYLGNYLLWNMEWRKYWASHSYVYAFLDVAGLSLDQEHLLTQWAEGVGLGLQLETAAGNFKLAYAVGKTRAQPFDFRQAKIHFGYVTVF